MERPRHGFTIHTFGEVPSTNDSILEAGSRGAEEGTTHIARSQTRGRGRAGRAWWSPPGAGLWMSTLLRPSVPRASWTGLALVAGVAARRALAGLGVVDVELEWPNDLVVGRKKIGGVLCEVRARNADAWIAVGIGVNIDLGRAALDGALPAELRDRITWMAAEGFRGAADPEAIARAILAELRPLYRRFLSGEEIPQLVGPDLAHSGRAVRVDRPGGDTFEGRIEGLGRSGELLVRAGDGTLESIAAGDVHYEPAG